MTAQDLEVWDIQKILHWTTAHFDSKKISSARLDAEVLLAHVLGCKRLDLYLKFDQPLTESDRYKFKELVKRRTTFEPVAYILGEKEFYGRPFKVGAGVLVPRPETEHIIDEAIHWYKNQQPRKLDILDIATGSGCLAATLAAEVLDSQVTALDISEEALNYARSNFEKLQLTKKIETINQDFLDWAKVNNKKFDLIVSNPPYIAKTADLMADVRDFEPPLALYGGEVGTETVLSWIPLMIEMLKEGGLLLCEVGSDQKSLLQKEISKFNPVFIKDYSGHDRIIKITK